MVDTPILTTMRSAVWDAIDNWPPLRDRFKRKYRFEDADALDMADLVPALGDLPAIALVPAGGDSPWSTNQGQTLSYDLDVWLWTLHWDAAAAEALWTEFAIALHQCAPSGSGQTYLDAAAVKWSGGPFARNPVALDGMTLWVWRIRLERLWNPRLAASVLPLVT